MIVARCLLAGVFVFGCASEPAADPTPSADAASTGPDEWLIVPGDRIGPVTADRSEADLLALLGDSLVVARDVYIGEGYCVPGTVVYPNTADALEIVWRDSTRARPAFIELSETGPDSVSRWHTIEGVRLGLTLPQLEVLNGKPFGFGGLGWDYGGWGGSWEEGALAAMGQTVALRFAEHPDSAFAVSQDPNVGEIYGERPVRSDHPIARRAGIRVATIALRLGPDDPDQQRFCG